MRVVVPASTANLGSGFDCVGVALSMFDTIDVDISDRGLRVVVHGEGANQVPTDDRHLVVATIKHCLQQWGHPMPGLSIETYNVIPHSRGLGSSASAIVGAIAAAWGIAYGDRPLDREELLRISTELEGHPDNAGASVYGGGVLAWSEGANVELVSLDLHENLRFRAFIPDFETPTEGARTILPTTVPRLDAVAQATHAALLTYALTQDPSRLLAATSDRLHQHYRAGLMELSYAWMTTLREAQIAATISGAGPTVLAIGTTETLKRIENPAGFAVCDLDVADGVRVTM